MYNKGTRLYKRPTISSNLSKYLGFLRSGEVSLAIWSWHADFQSCIINDHSFDCFHGLSTQKYLHSIRLAA